MSSATATVLNLSELPDELANQLKDFLESKQDEPQNASGESCRKCSEIELEQTSLELGILELAKGKNKQAVAQALLMVLHRTVGFPAFKSIIATG